MAEGLLFACFDPADQRLLERLIRRLPSLVGLPIRIERTGDLRDRHGPVHAGSFLRERRIAFDCARHEFPRIFFHELFHFVWRRLGNPARYSYERLLEAEIDARAHGELGWSAEWRKKKLSPGDRLQRTRRWREYCCESFCDTAAWAYSGRRQHPEFTLAKRFQHFRQAWFSAVINGRVLPI